MKSIRRFRRIRSLSAAVILAALCFCALFPASSESGGEALTVGVPVDRCPVFYLDAETGEVTGIGADLTRAAAEEFLW